MKTSGQLRNMVSMAVPDFQAFWHILEKRGFFFDIQMRGAILAPLGALHFSAQRVREPVHSVTNSQHGHVKRQHFGIAFRCVGVVHRTGPAGEHDSHGLLRANLLERCRARQDRGKHLLLANPPRNQLRVLTAEIQHHNAAFCAHRSPAFFLQGCRSVWCHSVASLGYRNHFITIFTNLPGTTMTLTISLPATSALILGSLMARSSVSSLFNPALTRILPRSLPLI